MSDVMKVKIHQKDIDKASMFLDMSEPENIKKPKMIRKRFIPYETKDISRDRLLYRDEELIITAWEVINPRVDFQKGVSYALLNKGLKISFMFDGDNNFVRYYCDIIEPEYDSEIDQIIFVDLLLDVSISAQDNILKVLDEDELYEALEKQLITEKQAQDARRKLEFVLDMISHNIFTPDEVLKVG